MKPKYCGICKHFLCWNYGDGLLISVGEECNHPDNVRYDVIADAEGSYKKKVYIRSHKEINRGNNCAWYKYTIIPRDAFCKDMILCAVIVLVLVAVIFSPGWLSKLF